LIASFSFISFTFTIGFESYIVIDLRGRIVELRGEEIAPGVPGAEKSVFAGVV
jgi:hypothetical protein